MYAVEFNAQITDGKIEIPKEYLQKFDSNVRIIMLSEYPKSYSVNLEDAEKKNKSLKGILNKYANPELISLEKEAWGKAVCDKHVMD